MFSAFSPGFIRKLVTSSLVALSPFYLNAATTSFSDINQVIVGIDVNVQNESLSLSSVVKTSKEIASKVSLTASNQAASISSALESLRCFVDPLFKWFTQTPEVCKEEIPPVAVLDKKVEAPIVTTVTPKPSVIVAQPQTVTNIIPQSSPSLKGFVTENEFQTQISLLNNAIKNISTANTTVYVGGGAYSVPSPDLASTGYVNDRTSSVSTIFSQQIVDLQTALGSSTASQWTTSGSDIYYNTGNVGIGTTTPGSELTVTGNGLFTGNLTANAFIGDGSQLSGITSFSTSTIRNIFSSSATGLSYATSSGVFSLTGGYVIPLVASSTEWATAYASTTALNPTYLRGLFSNSVTGLTYSNGDTSLTSGYIIPLVASTTEWANKVSFQYASTTYLARANHTGTQLSSTISDFSSTALGLFSSSANGLTYSSGVTSLTSGYVIPLVASSTEWATAYASTTALSPTYLRSLFSNSVTGLTYSNGVTSLTSGYNIPLTASTTDFQTAFTNRITSASTPLSIVANVISIQNAAADGSTKGAAAFNATNFSASSGVINTIQDISTTAIPTFASTTFSNFTAGSIPFFATSGSLNQNNSNLFWDNSNARLGIGTSTPVATVQISGRAGSANLLAISSSTNARLFTITAGGNVVIGSTTPSSAYALTIQTSGNFISMLDSSGIQRASLGGGTIMLDSLGGSGQIGARYFVDTSNNKGYWDTAQSGINWLNVNRSTSNINLKVQGISGQTANLFQVVSSSNAMFLNVTASGNVGVGSSTPGYGLSVGGTVGFGGLTAAGATSDALCIGANKELLVNTGGVTCTVSSARFKHNILGLDSTRGLSFISSLRPVSFDYNDSNKRSFGFIAEEVDILDSRLVFYEADGVTPRGVNYEMFTPILTKAIQELNQNMENLASTTASKTDETGNKTFIGRFFDRIIGWFAETANGIGDFFANRVRTKTLCIGDEATGETCINKTQLDQIILNAGSPPAPIIPVVPPSDPIIPPDNGSTTPPVIDVVTPPVETPPPEPVPEVIVPVPEPPAPTEIPSDNLSTSI